MTPQKGVVCFAMTRRRGTCGPEKEVRVRVERAKSWSLPWSLERCLAR